MVKKKKDAPPPFIISTREKGVLHLTADDIFSISKKNFGTGKKPVTRITLRASTQKQEEEVLHVFEGPRKFIRRFEEFLAKHDSEQPVPKQKKMKRLFTDAKNWYPEIKEAIEVFMKEYRFMPNCISFKDATWEKMIVTMNIAPHRVETIYLRDLLLFDIGGEEKTYWFHNEDDSIVLLLSLDAGLKKNEFKLQYDAMGNFMKPDLN